jgi:hypothetical protein
VSDVFGKKARLIDAQQGIQVLVIRAAVVVCRIMIAFLPPGFDQMPARNELALERTRARRIVTADLELAGASGEAVADPALQDRIVVMQGGVGEVKRVAVGYAVTNVDFAGSERHKGESGQQADKYDSIHDGILHPCRLTELEQASVICRRISTINQAGDNNQHRAKPAGARPEDEQERHANCEATGQDRDKSDHGSISEDTRVALPASYGSGKPAGNDSLRKARITGNRVLER